MEQAAEIVIKDGLSVRQTEALVARMQQEQPEKPRAVRRKSSEWKVAEKELGELYETKVQLSGTEERGKITLEYYSKEQLYALYDFLKRK